MKDIGSRERTIKLSREIASSWNAIRIRKECCFLAESGVRNTFHSYGRSGSNMVTDDVCRLM